MCFKQPKPPPPIPPPPIPTPPNPHEAIVQAEDAAARRDRLKLASRSDTVATSPTGDVGYGANVAVTRLPTA